MVSLQNNFKSKYLDKLLSKDTQKKSIWHWTQVYTVCILQVILMLIVFKLAWDCNKNSTFLVRLFITTISTILSELYIIYFAIYRIFLGNSCF